MRTKADIAAGVFLSGFNCAQSVLSVFCEAYGLDAITARKLAAGLGAGARKGELCGAVSGAVIVIGLKCGQSEAVDKAAKADCNARTAAFMELFQSKNKSFVCKEILGLDLSIPAEYARAQTTTLFQTTCVDMVKSAVTLLEELGY